MIQMNRRRMLIGSGAVFAASAVGQGATASAQAAAPGMMYPYTLPPLPYAANANEPYVDAETMTIHHDRHHAAYVSNLNAALKDYPQAAAMPLHAMLGKLGELPEAIRAAVRNNGGGHANHALFWQLMGGQGGEPSGVLGMAIQRDFGSFKAMKESFTKAGLTQFGSGWAMVTVDEAGRMAVTARPNQDTPLMEGKRVLFANDVWEHAYYLRYQNRRADYLAAWWNVLDWDFIANRYTLALAGRLEV